MTPGKIPPSNSTSSHASFSAFPSPLLGEALLFVLEFPRENDDASSGCHPAPHDESNGALIERGFEDIVWVVAISTHQTDRS